MIIGVGIDVVEIARFEQALNRTQGLASRLFTDGERILPPHSLAARFAAKEALAKALGAPRGLLWTDAEVVTHDGGRPALRVYGTVAAAAGRLGVTQWHLSLSHDAGIASAVVIAEGDRPAGLGWVLWRVPGGMGAGAPHPRGLSPRWRYWQHARCLPGCQGPRR